MRRKEGELLELLQSEDNGQRTDNNATVSSSESESSCDEEIANAMQTSLRTRFQISFTIHQILTPFLSSQDALEVIVRTR